MKTSETIEWSGPFGKYGDQTTGFVRHYKFKKGDNVCYTPDPTSGMKPRVFECVDERYCSDSDPVSISPDNLRLWKYKNSGSDILIPVWDSDNYWLQNSPTLNRGTPWRLTRYICDSKPPKLEAYRYNSVDNYLPGDYIVHNDVAGFIFVCVLLCDDNNPVDSQTNYARSFWHKITDVDYEIVEIEYTKWDVYENCQPIDFEYYPSPNFYPPNPIK